MVYTEQTKKAWNLCFEAHKNQVDKGGMPYVFHPLHLAEQMTDEKTLKRKEKYTEAILLLTE